jgi:hypothetical protein
MSCNSPVIAERLLRASFAWTGRASCLPRHKEIHGRLGQQPEKFPSRSWANGKPFVDQIVSSQGVSRGNIASDCYVSSTAECVKTLLMFPSYFYFHLMLWNIAVKRHQSLPNSTSQHQNLSPAKYYYNQTSELMSPHTCTTKPELRSPTEYCPTT